MAAERPLLAGGLAGAVLLGISQFLKLYGTHIDARHVVVDTVTVGSDHGYALLPVALLAALLAYGVWRVLSRPALLAIGLLGLASLLITLLHDLPGAHAQGLKTFQGHYVLAINHPEVGLYVETAGALVLLLTCVLGFMLLGPPEARDPAASGGARRPAVTPEQRAATPEQRAATPEQRAATPEQRPVTPEQ